MPDNERKVFWLFNKRILGWKVHLLHGSVAWEIQVGTAVVQWFYKGTTCRAILGRRLRVWQDEFGGRHA